MKYRLLTFLLIMFAGRTLAQSDSVQVAASLVRLDEALIGKDEVVLKQLLHNDLFFGHSNGWVQNKQQVLDDLKSGLLAYLSFKNRELSFRSFGNRAVIQEKVEVEVALRGNPLQLKLLVTEEWIREKDSWKLILRQGAKL